MASAQRPSQRPSRHPSQHPSQGPATAFEQTLAAAREGDSAALAELYEQFYPGVERMVHRNLARDLRVNRPWLSTRFSTGDVVQEVFRSVLQDIRSFAGSSEDAFSGYLAMLVRNRLVDAIRFHEAAQRDGRRTKPPPESSDPASYQDEPSADASSAEESEALHDVLASFDERERLLLRARLEHGEKFQVLADQLGYTSASAARRAFYSAQALLVIRMRQRQSGLDAS